MGGCSHRLGDQVHNVYWIRLRDYGHRTHLLLRDGNVRDVGRVRVPDSALSGDLYCCAAYNNDFYEGVPGWHRYAVHVLLGGRGHFGKEEHALRPPETCGHLRPVSEKLNA